MEILFPDRLSTRRSITYHTTFIICTDLKGYGQGLTPIPHPLENYSLNSRISKFQKIGFGHPLPLPPPPTRPGPSTPPFLDPRRNMYYIKLWRMTWNKNEILNMIKYFKIMSYQNCVKSQTRRARTLNSNLERRTDNQVWNYHNYIWFKSLKMQKKYYDISYIHGIWNFICSNQDPRGILEKKPTRNEVDSGT